MSAAKKRPVKYIAPKDEVKDDSDGYSSADSDDDLSFYQSRFPLPTKAPKPAPPARPSPTAPKQAQSEQWTEVHDSRREKYQQRRSVREAELAALQAEAAENARNEFSSLPRFVPYARDAAGKWLGAKSQHKAKPKQLGVIEEYIVPDSGQQHGQKQKKGKKRDDLLLNGVVAGKEWSGEADMADSIVKWIEHQLGDEAMTVAQIGERIQARVGDSWNKRYKQKYGALVEWLRSREQLLVHGDRVTVRQREEQQQQEQVTESRERRQQRERREADAARAEAAAVRVVNKAERSWLAFLLYVAALLAVVYGAYSVWSGRNVSDLARQLAEQLEAMEEKVVGVTDAAGHRT